MASMLGHQIRTAPVLSADPNLVSSISYGEMSADPNLANLANLANPVNPANPANMGLDIGLFADMAQSGYLAHFVENVPGSSKRRRLVLPRNTTAATVERAEIHQIQQRQQSQEMEVIPFSAPRFSSSGIPFDSAGQGHGKPKIIRRPSPMALESMRLAQEEKDNASLEPMFPLGSTETTPAAIPGGGGGSSSASDMVVVAAGAGSSSASDMVVIAAGGQDSAAGAAAVDGGQDSAAAADGGRDSEAPPGAGSAAAAGVDGGRDSDGADSDSSSSPGILSPACA